MQKLIKKEFKKQKTERNKEILEWNEEKWLILPGQIISHFHDPRVHEGRLGLQKQESSGQYTNPENKEISWSAFVYPKSTIQEINWQNI